MVAPAPPETIPGRPPKMAVTNPIIKAAYNPVKGESPARMANERDSGIMVIATVNPARSSFLKLIFCEKSKSLREFSIGKKSVRI